jgi:hypothetical protein
MKPPGMDLLIARLRQRQKAQAQAAQQEKQEEMVKGVLGIATSGGKQVPRRKGK